ncbi:uncharacterized protein EAF01_011156 [Botrytis porri]|uniref:Uncharacterized protein n=1 Tax=Botrytis porri TaxID=87229 RepID=A0A4Z1KAZ7_9HELO|nr:uncharacterized protein EAF01_011156 [Botrytis porri]KAF7888002.1 hypothetical protein EAF01_011156 [Botrytis porri]TGO83343.1 hypothetical protein BPOR_0661g00060 [Botrytis porri]
MKSNDATPNGRDDKLWYFKNYDDSITGKQFDEAYASNPGDKNYPVDWISGTEANPITGTLDKKPFKVWGLTRIGDAKTFVTGYADLGGASMRCYNNSASYWKQDYGEKMYVKCSANYYCTRNSRQIRRTIVTTSSTMQSIPFLGQQNYDIKNDHGSNAADGEGYKIGSKDYKMTYAVNRMEREGDPYYEADRINQVADLVVEKVFPELWAKDKISDEKAWPSGSKFLAQATHTLPFPKQIKVQVQVAQQAMLDWEDRDTVVFTVEKGNDCKVDSVLSMAIKGAFKAVSTVTTGADGAVGRDCFSF